MLGDGFLKQMGDTLKYNRELLGKKKSAREVYKEEVKQRKLTYESYDLNEVRARVEKRLKRNKWNEFANRTIANVLLLAIGYGIYWAIQSWAYFGITEKKPIDGTQFFKTVVYHQSKGIDLRVDFFHRGPKASETFFKDGLRHQNSESYYESGEQFRSALYYRDTLVTELYLFKSGDTIKNFPMLTDKLVHRIKVQDPKKKATVEFDFYDGKIIPDTYKEYYSPK
jgi:hypothetical protein